MSPGGLDPLSAGLRVLASGHGVPGILVDSAALQRIGEELACLPPVASAAGFEARLAPGATTVDFATLVAAGSPGVRTLAALAAPDSPHRHFLAETAWENLAVLGRRWLEPPLCDELPAAILEFDAAPTPRPVPVPSVFVKVPLRTERAARSRALDALAILLGGDGASDPIERLFRCLPDGGRVLQVAAMLGRCEGLRAFLSVPGDALVGFLRALAFPGDAQAIRDLWRRYALGGDRAALQLDLGDGVGPRVGLEVPFGPPGAPQRARQIRAHLERLVADGLCSDAKREALRAWTGALRGQPGPGSWPVTVFREVSHVKVACTAGGAVEAKAYFYFVPRRRLFD